MGVHLHKDLGYTIASAWGRSGEDETSLIKGMTTEQQLLAVNAAMIDAINNLSRKLNSIQFEIDSMREMAESANLHPFSKLNLRGGHSSFSWSAAKSSGLSMRARTVLFRLEQDGATEINESILLQQKGCGEMTKREIMEWIRLGCPVRQ